MGQINRFISQTGKSSRPVQTAPSPFRFAGKLIILASIYYVIAVFSLQLALPPGVASPFWPPSAIALCACLKCGWRVLPVIWLSSTLANFSTGVPMLYAAIIGTGNCLEAGVATLLIQRFFYNPPNFIHPANIFKFIGIAAFSSVFSASIGVACIWLINHPPLQLLALNWVTWWAADATGMIVVAPILLTWSVPKRLQWTTAQIIEVAAFAVLLPTITHIVFSNGFGRWPLTYLPIPFVIWAAFRFKLPAVTWTTGTICVITVWHTAHGNGPFWISDALNTSILLLMGYLSTVGTIGLVLASLLHQHSEIQKKLENERDALDSRVQSRTQALLHQIEESKRIGEKLQMRERQLTEAQQLAQIGSWNWDIDSGSITWSDELYRIYGMTRESFDVTLGNCRALIHEADLPVLRRVFTESQQSGDPFYVEHRIVLPSGTTKTVAARGYVCKSETGRVTRMFGTVQDITEAKLAELSLREAEERYRLVVELCPDAIFVQQQHTFVFANQAAAAMLGTSDMGAIVGTSIFKFIHPDSHESVRQRFQCQKDGETVTASEEKFIALDGTVIDVEVNSAPFTHKGQHASLIIMRDITEQKKSVQQMAYLAHYDSLTGLPNRALFHQRLAHALTIAERPGRSLEILFLDLDRFKNINDTLGHAMGDLVLKETAQRLQSILRESDTVARLGGDEFVVLVENVDEPYRGGVIAEKILAAFSAPFLQDKQPLSISTSIGIASYPVDGAHAEMLLKNADSAMYCAKEMGRNNYRYYSPAMNSQTAARLSLEYALSQALAHHQLSLVYQPKIDILSNKVIGVEALLRWQHPTLGWVPPKQFIVVAEETGLIKSIGYWVLRTACLPNKYWQEADSAHLKVAVNLSQRQLADDNLIPAIVEILDATQLDPGYLELEVTESAVMSDPERAITVLDALRDMGISVAIDDFGAGYSCLSYLKQFPIQAVKIDRSFVHGIPGDRGDAAITKAIIGLAHSLDCRVIAAGTETRQQLEFLREHACDSVQGYYFSKPLPAEHFKDFLKVQPHVQLH